MDFDTTDRRVERRSKEAMRERVTALLEEQRRREERRPRRAGAHRRPGWLEARDKELWVPVDP